MSLSGFGMPIIGGGAFDPAAYDNGEPYAFNVWQSLFLSGANTVVLKYGTYTVEHQMPGMEGGVVEYLGKPVKQVEIHGGVWESGRLALLSGLAGAVYGPWTLLLMPSFNSGKYFIGKMGTYNIGPFDSVAYDSGAYDTNVVYFSGVFPERFLDGSLSITPAKGASYPYYHWTIKGILSGTVE